ncbi:MAG: hypothetical protein K2Y71_18135 [Xanthobacteraceae bacterium]|nr:hypothetical protein [Xanthobacteraceae bacterium]
MARQSSYSREFAEVERRVQHLEQRLDRLGSLASRTAANGFAGAAHATERVSDALVSALSDLVDRFRGGARSVGGEAARFGQDAARLGHEASKLGSEALRRVSTEVERRPLMMIGVAIGVGLLIGWAGRRH